MKFKEGDRVIGKEGMIGKIVGFSSEAKAYLVEYENGGMHNGGGFSLDWGTRGKYFSCQWERKPKFVYSKYKCEIKEVLYGTRTTIIKWSDGTQTEAVCSPEDNFDKQVGFAIAYTRKMNGGKLSE